MGKNYELENVEVDGHPTINIKIRQTEEIPEPVDDNNGTLKIQLEHVHEFTPMSIYKALVKFALGILPTDVAAKFMFAKDWLLGHASLEAVPLVLCRTVAGYESRPYVVAFVRKEDSQCIFPFALGEFHVMNMIFVYIIPTGATVEKSYLARETWDRLRSDMFKIYEGDMWSYRDYSSTLKMKPTFRLNILKRSEK